MDFYTDQQTLDDLCIFGKYSEDDSIFHLFARTRSHFGKKKMEQLFLYPLTDANEINNRSGFISYLGSIKDDFSLEYEELDFIEYYLSLQPLPSRISYIDAMRRHFRNIFNNNNSYYIIRRGVVLLIENLCKLNRFLEHLSCRSNNPLIVRYSREVKAAFENEYLRCITRSETQKKFSPFEYQKLDFAFRYIARDKIRRLMDVIYELDAFTTAAAVAKEKRWGYAVAVQDSCRIQMERLFHPLVASPVPNDILLDNDKNILFVTGANMAGKSTFMKAFGTALYLAHMGFPVPALSMQFGPQQGLVSTINLSDDLKLGYSHFYAEVKRVKEVVSQLDGRPRLVILFDELFRGTNVKDAYDATVSVIGALARSRNCFIVVSTHIVEAAQDIRKKYGNVQFYCFHTHMDGDEMRYSYQLAPGISDDRLGMVVIRREQIIEIIENRI